MEQKRTREGHSYEGQGTQDDSHATSSQGERTLSYVLKGSNHNDRDSKLENLWRQVRELELKASSRHRRKAPEGSSHDQDSVSGHIGSSTHQSHFWLSRDKSNKSSITEERKGWAPKRCHERHEPNTTEDSPVTFFRGNRMHWDAKALHSPSVHLL